MEAAFWGEDSDRVVGWWGDVVSDVVMWYSVQEDIVHGKVGRGDEDGVGSRLWSRRVRRG